MVSDAPVDLPLSGEPLDAIRAAVHTDTPEGYELFYWLVHNRQLPPHAREWIDHVYQARRLGKDAGIEAFRGSTKTTTLTITYVAYQIGLRPHLEWALFQAGDDMAAKNTAYVADIIENNPGWRALFPNVAPDKAVSWGQNGYQVKRLDMDYGEWRRICSRDYTLVGYGYKSKIIGYHPRGGIVVDDIHDEENSSSDAEMKRVKKLFSGTIVPMANPTEPGGATTFLLLVGTPWTREDTLMSAKATGQYLWLETPAVRKDGTLTWPELFSQSVLDGIKQKDLTAGKTEFPRMYLLDLSAGENRTYKFQLYPAHALNLAWPLVGGVDYASVADPTRRNSDQSHFALAYVAKLPTGGAVVVDGVLEQCTAGDALAHVQKAQSGFPNWLITRVEGDGKGEDFFQLCLMDTSLKVRMEKVGNRKSKAQRLYEWLGPKLQFGHLKISSAETPFLSALRRFLTEYPNVSAHDPGWDAADAVLQAVLEMKDVFLVPAADPDNYGLRRRPQPNPFSAFGQQRI